MALGPFITYVPPGVYTRTLTEANVANIVAGLRIPVVIGVGQEELEQDNVELVRGSSSTVDQAINAEDVSLSWVVNAVNPNNLVLGAQDGNLTQFRVKNFPIVDGQGFGRTTNDPRTVTVTVNGVPVAVATVVGNTGLIGLQVPTQPTDVVRCTYFFHRGDTAFTDDVSDQVTTGTAVLTSPGFEPFNITTGSNDQFVFSVAGVQFSVTLPQGALTAAAVKASIDVASIPNLQTSVFTDNQGLNHLLLTTPISLSIGDGNANGPLGWSAGTATNRNAAFKVYNRPIVDGTSGGITTTDTSKVVVKVNNVQVIPATLDGANGIVNLPFAPAQGSTVTVAYYANTWQDTFDYLPNTLVTTVIRCGISVNRADFIQNTDFVVSNPSPDVSIIHWGTSYGIAAGSTSPGGVPFDKTQITTLLVDNKFYLAPCVRVVDTTVIPAVVSSTDILLPEIPTTGNGRSTPLGLPLFNAVTNGRQDLVTNRPDLVQVYVGRSLRDALNRPAVKVLSVDGVNRRVVLKNPVPPDYQAWATFYYNNIGDDTFIFANTVAGAIGSGQFTVTSSALGRGLYQTRFGNKIGFAQTVQWPRGVETIPDAYHTGNGTPVAETVTVLFGTAPATNAGFTNRNADPYSFYTPFSANWTTQINGTPVVTNLASAAPGIVVSAHVVPIQSGPDAGKITIPASPNNVLNLSIDGGATVPVTLTVGNRTPTQIITEINAVLLLTGTAAFYQIGPSTGDVIFTIVTALVPGALPGGFDSPSGVKILQGTVEGVLGFQTFQTGHGTTSSLNKPATLLGSLAGPFNITAALNDLLNIRVNGIDYQVVLPAGAAVTTAAVVAAIAAVPGLSGVASVGTLANLGKLRLTSLTNDNNSAVLILAGSANATLGFVQNQSASQTRVGAQEVVDSLMATAGFTAAGGVAYVDRINNQNFITFESLTVGAATSSIGFVNSVNSAFNPTTGIGLTPGTDGDVGEDAQQIFTVSSNNPQGSAGTGQPGQTYTDAVTSLRFSLLPASTGQYTPGGSFTMNVSPTFQVDPSRPWYSIPGLETTVSNTVGVFVGDTGTLQTFHPSGIAPAVGDFYFVSYRYLKQDYTTRIFQQLKTIEANFGPVSAQNRVTLAAYLAILNGTLLVGIKQVLKVPNTNQASDTAFITAIQELATPLPGNIKPDILIPLTTTTAVYAYLTNHCEVQSNIRNQAERMGFIGFASGTVPTTAQTIAKSLVSSRIVAFYPDSAVITLTDELGQAFESLIDGSFFGAAVAGAVVSPTVDVATPYTRRRLQGFTRIPRILDPVEANQTAVAGVTLLDDLDPIIRIRQGLTTNMNSILTRLPTVTQIADFVQQQSRAALDSFVGTKFLASRTNEVNVSMTALFKQLVQAEIVGAFTGINSNVDVQDPTILNFEAFYQPVFPLLYLVLTFNLRARI